MKLKTTFAKYKKKIVFGDVVPRFIGIRVLYFSLFLILFQFFVVLKVWLIFPIFWNLFTKKIQNFPKCFFHYSAKIDKKKNKRKTNKQTLIRFVASHTGISVFFGL